MSKRQSRNKTEPLAAPGVEIHRVGDVLTFTLNNPARGNEVTVRMLEEMLAELRAQAAQPAARVLRLAARGKAFCTGRERTGRDAASIRAESARLLDFKCALRTTRMISVAEVQGDACGFGFGLAILYDFAFAAERASLAFPEMRGGLPPSAIMAYLDEYTLPRWAFPMVLLGDPISAKRAQEIGLITKVCSARRLTAETDALIERILRLDPAAAWRCKEFFLNAQQNSFVENARFSVDALTEDLTALLARKS